MRLQRITVRRAYDEPAPDDGTRVLVDRLWPRGLSKDEVAYDEWIKAVAPSNELRKWYGHEPERFADFSERYTDELSEPERAEALDELRILANKGPLTLLTATKDVEHSHAAVLVSLLRAG